MRMTETEDSRVLFLSHPSKSSGGKGFRAGRGGVAKRGVGGEEGRGVRGKIKAVRMGGVRRKERL